MNPALPVAGLVFSLAFPCAAGGTGAPPATPPAPPVKAAVKTPKPQVMVDLNSPAPMTVNARSGWARLEDAGQGRTLVTLSMSQNIVGGKVDGGPGPFPARIRLGVCSDPSGLAYALNDVLNGRSKTLLEVPLSRFLAPQGSMDSPHYLVQITGGAANPDQVLCCGDFAGGNVGK